MMWIIRRIIMAKDYDICDNYIMFEAHSLKYLKELGIAKSVEEKLPLQQNKLTEGKTIDIEDVNTLLNIFIGTLINNCLTKEDLLENCVEFELPKVMEPLFKEGIGPILKWKELYFSTIITKYNQLVMVHLPENIPEENWFCHIESI